MQRHIKVAKKLRIKRVISYEFEVPFTPDYYPEFTDIKDAIRSEQKMDDRERIEDEMNNEFEVYSTVQVIKGDL